MTIVEAVAKRTNELLKEKDISQYRLRKETCLDKTTIQTILKCKTKDIKMSTVFLIAEVFGLSVSEFFDMPYFSKENIDL